MPDDNDSFLVDDGGESDKEPGRVEKDKFCRRCIFWLVWRCDAAR